MIERRKFVLSAATALITPSSAFAQAQARQWTIGVLVAGSGADLAAEMASFRAGMREFGYIEGGNLAIEFRGADGQRERLRELAAELVTRKCDAIVTYSGQVARTVMQASSTIPIVMAAAGDPIASGLTTNLARPDTNVTGSTFFAVELAVKRLELLKELLPNAKRIAMLFNRSTNGRLLLPAMGSAAQALKVDLQLVDTHTAADFGTAFATVAASRADGALINEEGLFITHGKVLGTLAGAQRFPSIGFVDIAGHGALLAYGVDLPAMWRRAAVYVDKLLKGAKPADLPIERATRFELVVNSKTARAHRIKIPNSILVQTTGLIE